MLTRLLKTRFALLMAGLLSGLLLSEVVLIVFAPQVKRLPRVWRYDKDLGWEHIPGARGRMVAPEFSATMEINAAGQRDRDYPEERLPNSWRVVARGDSYVEGWGVELEASVTKLLEERLQQARADERVEVINMGVAGYGTDQELLYYERDGQQYQPDDVLVFFYGNDIWNNFTRAFKPYYILGPGDRLQLAGVPVRFNPTWDMEYHDTRPWPQRARRYLRRHWHLYALIRKVFVPAQEDPQQRRRYYESLYGRDLAGRWQEYWELSGRLLEKFDRLVRQSGARMHVVFVPSMVQIYPEEWEQVVRVNQLTGEFDLEKPNRQLASFAARFNLSYLDLYPAFLQHQDNPALYFRMDSHWNEAGHQVAAEAVADFLLTTVSCESAAR